MPNMSLGKNARHVASITNRPTCGGNKKQGLPPSVWQGISPGVRWALRRAIPDRNYQFRSCASALAAGMPVSRNPACSGGVGRIIPCGIWRW